MKHAAILLLAAAPVAASAQSAAPVVSSSVLLGTGINVTDLARSLKFYQQGLDMVESMRLEHLQMTEVMLSFETERAKQASTATLILMLAKGARPTAAPGFGKLVLRVVDIEATAARLKAAGFAPGAIGGSTLYRTLNLRDPDGYHVEIVQVGSPQ